MRIFMVLLMILPGFAFAVGGGDTSPPPTTKTTKTCKGVKVWDASTKKCVNPEQSGLDQGTLMGAVRELAYAGRIEDAQGVLRVMDDQNSDMVLTYWGFTSRKLGKGALAQAYYMRAITKNPDNILARSYMAQGFVAQGRIDEATAQLREIRARGGKGSWAEVSLDEAIRTGNTYNY